MARCRVTSTFTLYTQTPQLRCFAPKPYIYTSSRPHTCYMPRLSHYSQFYTRTMFGEHYKSLSSSLCSLLHSPVTSSLLCPNILLSTLFSYTLSLRSSLSVSDQVSHPYKAKGKFIVLYIFMFIFVDNKSERHKNYSQHSPTSTGKMAINFVTEIKQV